MPTDREISRSCAKFDPADREEAAYILWHLWKDKSVAYEACISALNEDEDLYQALKEAHEARKYKSIVNWGETPSAPLAPDVIVKELLCEFIDELRPSMTKLVRGEIVLEFWQPPSDDDQDPDVVEHLTSLEIPCLKGKPNILLHDLGTFQEDEVLLRRLQNIFMANNHTFLVNTSGSGKTRILLEGLCRHWGFYFTSLVDSSLLGSSDVENAISSHIPDSPGFRANLPPAGTPAYENALRTNRQLASRVFRQVLLARLLIFDLFVETMSEHPEQHPQLLKQRWLLLQLQPSILNPRVWDVFDHLSRELLSSASDAYINCQTKTLLGQVRSRLSRLRSAEKMPIFCVLDEAQHAASQHLPAFRSDHSGAHRPVLREIVRAWDGQCAGQGVFMVVAGTGISKDVVDQAMASAIMKDSKYRWCSDTGAFDQPEVQRAYLQRYFPPKYIESEAGCRLLDRLWYWLHGRHRFTAGYLSEVIADRFRRPHSLLNAYIRHFSGFKVTDAQQFVDEEPCLPLPVFSQVKIDFSKLRKNSEMLSTIHQLTTHYLMRSDLPLTLGKDEALYVEYGYARFVDAETKSVAADEPLVLLAATHWINANHLSSYKHFASQIHQHDPNSNGFENYLAFCIDMAFSGNPRQVCEVFSFVGAPPAWAEQRAQLVALERVSSSVVESGIAKRYSASGPSVTLGVNAKSTHETTAWLDGSKRSPMCFPDVNMGPDLLFVLKLEDGSQVWVALQAKYVKRRAGKDYLAREYLRKAMKSVTPSKFFLNKDGTRHSPSAHTNVFEETVQTLKALPNRRADSGSCSLLRVVVSFPADTRLKRGIEEDPDDEGHPIATLNMGLIKQMTQRLSPSEFLQGLEVPVEKPRTSKKRKKASSPAPRKRKKIDLNR
ncbi:hypothetical protein BKA70DRAFT_1207313 [Coprinopsis sp. MPI-PUGE-AT-0042]|nr:hypothetical protein BKA70DRAFT_1207313 [Coprinopsis sp. MPI-PUGE-AT-0042]